MLRCIAAATLLGSSIAAAQDGEDPTAALLRELIRANTSNPPGRTQLVDDVLAPRFRALGFSVKIIPTPDSGKAHIIARLRGDGSKRPVLVAAHGDVVGVEREKWSLEPFDGVEKDGFIYGRGAIDFKGGMAVFARAVMMLAERKVPLARDVIFLVEADEEGGGPYSTEWLAKGHWSDIDAEFALNEGGGVAVKDGKPIRNSVQTTEKVAVTFQLDVRDRGGHSSVPRKDNAIYRLAEGLVKLSKFSFPMRLNETTRAYFERTAQFESEQTAADIRAVLSDKPDPSALSFVRLAANPVYNAQLRTTCVATMLQGGHAENALPQLASAKVNCRIMPGEPVEEVKATLGRVLDDDQITVTQLAGAVVSAPSALHEEIVGTIEKLTQEFFPGAVVLPIMSSGATDGSYLRNAGIPTYGHSGMAVDINESRVHGRDERAPQKSFYQGNEYLYRLVKMLSGGA